MKYNKIAPMEGDSAGAAEPAASTETSEKGTKLPETEENGGGDGAEVRAVTQYLVEVITIIYCSLCAHDNDNDDEDEDDDNDDECEDDDDDDDDDDDNDDERFYLPNQQETELLQQRRKSNRIRHPSERFSPTEASESSKDLSKSFVSGDLSKDALGMRMAERRRKLALIFLCHPSK